MTIFHFIISFVLAYLFGSIPSGYWIGKIFYKKNILELGSGNIGTTNTFRTLGTIPGVVVLILDLCKGILGASMATIWGSAPHWMFMVVGLGAILGHTFSIWIGFKGGKAVATSVGVLLLYSPVMFLAAVIAFITAILLTSMVSVGSMLGFTVVTLLSVFWLHDWFLATIALVLTVFVFYRHRSNVKRILNGTESKVPFGLIYWLSKKS
ncbi:glycerol-3-phosphate 1-O-acyltransferase PlsY [Weissella paramesenteroides]|uniref:Glycerol-3-phosphate acyltransferase n=1 Tax=Weissella paramesenteroides ATCC 33313 TaxID=585506 RepID=C5RBE0_WEIPA|nr:glycerol-3-phosphate 1-O-acyltransferase PlsY [Weissella paramesenteroides]EER74497.1 acyl-phosphate glycerol 3-phosphate acyltransferase [Weissella paramesenteroides ATCC 33313]